MSKKVKILLAVLVCLIVVAAVGGYFAWQQGLFDKPAEPDNRWTVRNLTIDMGEEEITLAPEVRLRAVKGEDGTALEFEIGSGDKVLLPVRGEITAEGVNFAMGNSDRVYSANAETVLGLLELNEVNTGIVESVKGLVENYAALLQKSSDAAYIKENADVYNRMYEIMLNTTAKDAKIEVNGKKYNAKLYKGTMTTESIIALLDYMQTCENAEIAGFMDNLLEIMTLTTGEEYESYGAMLESLGDAGNVVSTDVELTVIQEKKMNYQRMTMKQEAADTGMAIESTAESISTPEGTTMTMKQTMGDPEATGTVMTMDMEIAGPQTAPTGIAMDIEYVSAMDYSDDDYTNSVTMAMTMNLDGAKEENLWNMAFDANVDTGYTYGYGDETDSFNEVITLGGGYVEAAEEDGSVTGAVDLKLAYGDADYGVAFDLNRGKDAVIEDITPEGAELHVLTADMEDDVYVQLAADAMDLAADATELAADESVQQLVEKFSALYAPTENSIEEYSDEYAYDETIEMVESFEEAAAIYAGEIPEYTAPEGYELDFINVNEYALEAVYTGGEKRFTYSLMDFGMDMNTEPEAAYLDDGEGNVFYAELVMGSSYVMFSFENTLPQAEAEVIVAGLGL